MSEGKREEEKRKGGREGGREGGDCVTYHRSLASSRRQATLTG